MWVDEDRQDPYNRIGGSAQGTPSVGAGGGVSSAPATPSGTTSNPSTQTPTNANVPTQNFGTVQDYLKGNQQQGEALGQKFTGNLSTNLTNEKSAIDTAAKQTQSDINAGATNYDANLVNKAVSSPTEITGNPDQLQSFLKQWNAAYTGPSSFEASTNYAPASSAASEAQNLGTEESTTGGQQQILHDQFGVYGQGNQGLDQAVLQNSSYFPKVQEQAKQFGTVQDYLSQQAQPINEAAQTAATNTAAAQTNTRNAFANMPTTFQNQINSEVTAAQQAAATQAAKYQSDLASGDISKITADIQAANPGVDTAALQSYLAAYQKDYGTLPDLSNQYNFNPNTQITAANVATPEEYAKAAAYGQLTGVDYGSILNPVESGQAGTAPTANTGLSPTNVQTYLKGQLDTKDKALLATPYSTDAIYNNQMNPAQADTLAQQYVDAAARQGVAYKDSQVLQDMLGKATTAMQGALAGGLPANNPQVQAYKAIIDRLSAYANSPASSVQPPVAPPINVTTPGGATPTNRSGNTQMPVTPTQLLNPTPIKNMNPEQLAGNVIDTYQKQIDQTPAGRDKAALQANMRQVQADSNQLKTLYTNYLSGNINASQYVQLQQLLKKYQLI